MIHITIFVHYCDLYKIRRVMLPPLWPSKDRKCTFARVYIISVILYESAIQYIMLPWLLFRAEGSTELLKTFGEENLSDFHPLCNAKSVSVFHSL